MRVFVIKVLWPHAHGPPVLHGMRLGTQSQVMASDSENAVTAFGKLPINASLTRYVCNQCHLGITGLMLQALSYLVQAEFPLVLPVEELSKDLTSIRMI